MKKSIVFKGLMAIIIVICLVIGVNIFFSMKRIQNYSILTPFDNLTFTEKIADKLSGSNFKSKKELERANLLLSDEYVEKENKKNIEEINKNDVEIECNFSKKELETIFINSEKYLGKNIEFTGIIATNIGVDEEEKQRMIKSLGEEKAKEMFDRFEKSDKESIVTTIKDTRVEVVMMYDKNKVNYDKWGKGTALKIKGTISNIDGDFDNIKITLKNDPNIEEI